MYFSGQDQSLQWLQQDTTNCPETELIVSGAGASTTELEGSNPVHYPTTVPDPLPVGFVHVVIRDRELTAEFIDSDGNPLFTRTITH